MPINSYLVYPNKGMFSELNSALKQLKNCDAIPSDNGELIILVTETADKQSDKLLCEKIQQLPGLSHMAMVAGFDNPKEN